MKYISLLIFFSLASIHCQNKNTFVTPTLTLKQKTTPAKFISFDEDVFRAAKFQPFYIGPNHTKIGYDAFSDYQFVELLDSLSCQFQSESPYPILTMRPLDIWVNTKQVITHYGFAPIPPPLPPDSICPINQENRKKQEIAKLNPIYSYPIFVYNNTDKHQVLGQFNSIGFDLEILKNGTWEHRQKALRGCGYDAILLLAPQQIVITSIPIFENMIGEKLRLNLNGNFSNEFILKK